MCVHCSFNILGENSRKDCYHAHCHSLSRHYMLPFSSCVTVYCCCALTALGCSCMSVGRDCSLWSPHQYALRHNGHLRNVAPVILPTCGMSVILGKIFFGEYKRQTWSALVATAAFSKACQGYVERRSVALVKFSRSSDWLIIKRPLNIRLKVLKGSSIRDTVILNVWSECCSVESFYWGQSSFFIAIAIFY